MDTIKKTFCGYLNVENETFAFNVDGQIVTLLPLKPEPDNWLKHIEPFIKGKDYDNQFFYGVDSENHQIAFEYRGGLRCDFSSAKQFSSPLIIKTAGNTQYFYDCLTSDWNTFHSIAFYGGNINAIYDPQNALRNSLLRAYSDDGSAQIEIRPFSERKKSWNTTIDGQKVEILFSIISSSGGFNDDMSSYTFGKLQSFMSFSFESPQSFGTIAKYYQIATSLVALLIKQNNITFDIYLSPRVTKGEFLKSAICKVFDAYDNYATKKAIDVISVEQIADYIPVILEKIERGDAQVLLNLLPVNNKDVGKMSITNVQDMCTALEVAYKWNSSATQCKKKNLKQKILTLHDDHKNVVDFMVRALQLAEINEENVGKFVELRNVKTHEGLFKWGDSGDLYYPLFILLYACFLKSVGVSDDTIKDIIKNVRFVG